MCCDLTFSLQILNNALMFWFLQLIDGLVGELLKYGGSGILHLLHKLFEVVWREEFNNSAGP